MVKTEAPACAKAAGNSYSLHLPLGAPLLDSAGDHGCKESDVIRAALAIGLQTLERPSTVQGMRDTLADDEITRVEYAVTDGDFELARKIVRRLQLDDVPLTIRTRLTNSLVHRDYLTALHIVDRLAAGKELQ